MRAETDAVVEPASARASTVVVIATMAAIAGICVVAVVGWARLGRSAASDADSLLEPIPSEMAGGASPGEVPAAVVEAMGDQPVVGVAKLDEVPDAALRECGRSFGRVRWAQDAPAIDYAHALPDAVSFAVVGAGEGPGAKNRFSRGGNQPRQLRLECTVTSDGGGWMAQTGGVQPARRQPRVFGGSGYTCCDENGLASATASVAVPEGSAWAVQERNGWYLAYPVKGLAAMTVSWKFQEQRFGPGLPPQSSITFLDDAGIIVDEAFVGGSF